jgi:transcriptional regulator with XRE-family HTH domain
MKSTSSDDTGVHRVTNRRELVFEHGLLRRLRLGLGLPLSDLAKQLHCSSSQLAAVEAGRVVPFGQLRAALEEWIGEHLAPVDSRQPSAARGTPSGVLVKSSFSAGSFDRCATEVGTALAVSRARTLRDTRERALDLALQQVGEAYVRANDRWFERVRARIDGDGVRAQTMGASSALMYRVAARHAWALAEQLAAAALLADDRERRPADPPDEPLPVRGRAAGWSHPSPCRRVRCQRSPDTPA